MMKTARKKRRTLKHFSLHLIEESDLAYCIHVIFQNQHIMPGIAMGLRTPNEPVTEGERAFMLASTKKALMDGDTPVKIRNFSSKNNKKGGST